MLSFLKILNLITKSDARVGASANATDVGKVLNTGKVPKRGLSLKTFAQAGICRNLRD